jgi:large subunit ribosomal protein L13
MTARNRANATPVAGRDSLDPPCQPARRAVNWEFPSNAVGKPGDVAVARLDARVRVMNTATVKSYVAKPGQVDQKWWLVDADHKVVGRLASDIAVILMGKHRPIYTPHVDCGDYIVVVNVDKIVLTGNKWRQKEYTWYTGYPGLKHESAGARFERDPALILTEAVRRMLPKNKLAKRMLDRLKVYAGDSHPHQAQDPQPKELGAKKEKKKT